MNSQQKDNNTLFEKVRKQFIGLDTEYTLATGETRQRIYLDSTATTLMMEAAHEVLERFYHHYGNTHSLLHFDAKIAVLSYSDRLHTVAIRPPIVYGPRDKGLLTFFRIVKKHLKLNLGMSHRYITLIHVSDLVQAMMLMAEKETVSGSYYYVNDGVPARSWFEVQNEVAKALDVWTIPLKLPLALAFVSIAAMHMIQKMTGRRSYLNLNKYSEMAQRAWICDGSKIREELGYTPKVFTEDGFRETAKWYRETGWL